MQFMKDCGQFHYLIRAAKFPDGSLEATVRSDFSSSDNRRHFVLSSLYTLPPLRGPPSPPHTQDSSSWQEKGSRTEHLEWEEVTIKPISHFLTPD